MHYFNLWWNSISGTANWVWQLITFKVAWYNNYFYGLIIISLIVWIMEVLFPWRKNQSIFRKDFWLDGFYMFFNFFLFSIVVTGFYTLVENGLNLLGLRIDMIQLINLEQVPVWASLLIFFIINDFVQWFTHVLLHRFNFLWQFHKVHHSVRQMGFAAHLRYHWMENILYKPLKTIAVMLIGGFEPSQAYIVHFIAITIGHLNHANVRITWGPFKYLINNPVMHLWHHVKALPKGKRNGVNFGISLSVWDYIFKSNYISDTQNGEIELGFNGVEDFPTNFLNQQIYGFKKSK